MPRGMGSSTNSNPSDTGKRSGLHGPAERHSSEYNYYSGRDSRDHSHTSNSKPTDQTITEQESVETEPVSNETTQNMNEAFVDTSNSITPQATDYSWVVESLENKKDKEKQTAELGTDYTAQDKDFTNFKSADEVANDFDFSSLGGTEGFEENADANARQRFKEFADLKGETYGPYTEDQIKQINGVLQNNPENRNIIQKIADFGTNLLSFGAANNVPGHTVPQVKDAQAYLDAIEKGADPNQLSKYAFGSAIGLPQDGYEYYKLTGDTNNNIYAEKAEERLVDGLTSVLNGEMSVDDYEKYQEKILSSPMQVWNDVWISDLKSMFIKGGSMVLGQAGGELLGQALGKLAATNTKLLGKVLSNNSKMITDKMSDKSIKALGDGLNKMLGKNYNWTRESTEKFLNKLGETIGNKANRSAGEALQKAASELFSKTGAKTVAPAVELALENVDSNVVKGAGAVGAMVAGTAAANAMDTGIANPDTGKTIDSSEIVERYQENPYRGEDAVTLQSLEGPVTLPPRQAVAVGEAENLRESDGYTEEVKEAAKVGENQTAEDVTAEIGAEFSEKEQIPAEEVTDLKWYERAFDYVQALLGGRDLNGDRTISAREWYESTIGKMWSNLKSIPSKISEGWNSVKDFTKNLFTGEYFKRIGNAVVSSKNYIVDVATGERSIVEDVKETFTEENLTKAGTAVADKILPDWNDSPEKELMHEAITDAVSQATSEYMYGDFGPIALCKFVGSYIAGTVAEMFHLSGHDLDPDTTKAINFMATNSMGIALAPTSTVLRNVMWGVGQVTSESIRGTFDPNRHANNYIEPANLPGRTTEATSDYGSSDTAGEGTYSGYKERAKNSNIAADYNAGMEEEVNEAVSDSRVKDYIVSIYSKEPDFIRKAIQKVIKSYKEAY